MLNVPEYITSVYQPFSSFNSVSGSCGNFAKTSGIIENFSGERGKPWTPPKCKDKNNIPYVTYIDSANNNYLTKALIV